MEMIKECAVCKNKFKPCQSCDGSVVQWRRVVCCPEHFNPHMTLIAFRDSVIDEETAKKELEDVIQRIGQIDFNDNVKGLLDKIYVEEADVIPMINLRKSKKK